MLGKERERSLPRDGGRLGVVVLALLAHEAMPGGVQEHGHLGVSRAYLLDVLERDQMVLFAEVTGGRTLRLLAHGFIDRAAVEVGCARHLEATGRQPRDVAAETVPDHPERARRTEMVGGGADVQQHLLAVDAPVQGARLLEVVGAVAELEPTLDAVVERRGDRLVSLAGVALALVADVAGNAKRLLDDDEAPADGPGGLGLVDTELVPIGCRQNDRSLPIRFTPTPTRARMGANRI